MTEGYLFTKLKRHSLPFISFITSSQQYINHDKTVDRTRLTLFITNNLTKHLPK